MSHGYIDDPHFAPSAEFLSRKANVVTPPIRPGRIPPQAIDMEQAVLGACLLEKDAIDRVAGTLTPEMFYKEGNRLIYESMVEMAKTSSPIDLRTVMHHLSQKGNLESVGGVFYLMELTGKVAQAANIEAHARVIQQKWYMRSIISICDTAVNDAYDETSDPFDLHSRLIKQIEDLEPATDELTNGMDFIPVIAQEAEDAMNGKSRSLKMGFMEMDGEYALDFKEYMVVAGDSGTGKTTFVMQIAKKMRKMYPDVPILFNARDMEGKKVVARDLASEMKLSQMRFRTGKDMRIEHFKEMNERALAYNGIFFCSEFTAAGIRAKCKRLRKNLRMTDDEGIVVINDYLQLGDEDGSSREQQVANASLEDKKVAIKQNALVIDLSQVNESAGKGRPNHKSIRESRAPYHHADWVIFLYSPSRNGEERYETGEPTDNIVEVIMDKVRCGAPGNTVKLWMNKYGLLVDMPLAGGRDDDELHLPKINPRDITIPNTERYNDEIF